MTIELSVKHIPRHSTFDWVPICVIFIHQDLRLQARAVADGPKISLVVHSRTSHHSDRLSKEKEKKKEEEKKQRQMFPRFYSRISYHRAPIDYHLQADDQMDAIPDNLWEDGPQ